MARDTRHDIAPFTVHVTGHSVFYQLLPSLQASSNWICLSGMLRCMFESRLVKLYIDFVLSSGSLHLRAFCLIGYVFDSTASTTSL